MKLGSQSCGVQAHPNGLASYEGMCAILRGQEEAAEYLRQHALDARETLAVAKQLVTEGEALGLDQVDLAAAHLAGAERASKDAKRFHLLAVREALTFGGLTVVRQLLERVPGASSPQQANQLEALAGKVLRAVQRFSDADLELPDEEPDRRAPPAGPQPPARLQTPRQAPPRYSTRGSSLPTAFTRVQRCDGPECVEEGGTGRGRAAGALQGWSEFWDGVGETLGSAAPAIGEFFGSLLGDEIGTNPNDVKVGAKIGAAAGSFASKQLSSSGGTGTVTPPLAPVVRQQVQGTTPEVASTDPALLALVPGEHEEPGWLLPLAVGGGVVALGLLAWAGGLFDSPGE